ncbi:A/G-specific adenine glycosylase [Pullulanibacillus camelliae]|uniref:Adenine DNA glycosylase n=1 Tax=Pullulanibacillus camelliae TaxID=1707096 RepID=A0A8J2YIF0_9BACL|nr:A/G-specific adenine glycosylase [Pullulanibacillus camelliae]
MDPYYIWISEVMLQQTQVDTVIPYYEKFITHYPTMHALAQAPQEEVLKHWEGLGYYSRARNLQAGVREVVENYDAQIPSDRKTLLNVKGIGPYTAGAILSIAYQKPEPAVDGNVMRVLSRIFQIDEDITKAKTRKTFEQLVYTLIPEDDASPFNQGLMELGALICKPKTPLCEACPLSHLCQARQAGKQTDYPVKSKKLKQKGIHYVAVVLQDDQGRYLIQQRPSEGLLAGFWEFPLQEISASTDEVLPSAEQFIEETFGTLSIKWSVCEETAQHIFSHLKWQLNVVQGKVLSGQVPSLQEKPMRWIAETELKDYPFPVPQQKIMKIARIAY